MGALIAITQVAVECHLQIVHQSITGCRRFNLNDLNAFFAFSAMFSDVNIVCARVDVRTFLYYFGATKRGEKMGNWNFMELDL